MTERRMARRYDLSLPVNVRMPINREPRSHSGQTRDISTRGVYFTMQRDLIPGTEVDFTLTLPAEITRGSEVFVRAHGRVIRVDKRSDDDHETIGVAAVIERYDIIRGEGIDPATPDVAVGTIGRIITENDVGQHTVMPLATQQAAQLHFGPLYVHMPPADGDETAIPQPLVRV